MGHEDYKRGSGRADERLFPETETLGDGVAVGNLCDLPNIGKELEKVFIQTGLDTQEKLRAAGAREAFIRVKALDPTACHSKLYAIDGAIKGIRWHNLSVEEKRELNEFYNSL